MPVTLPLNEITVSEKLKLMEALWANWSLALDALASPEWQRKGASELVPKSANRILRP
jgi:hypothetical protein